MISGVRGAVLAAVCTCLSIVAAQAGGDLVALHTDGRLQPLARFADGRWRALEPAEEAVSGRQWTRWGADGSSSPIAIRRGARPLRCDGATAIETDRPGQNARERDVALATSGALRPTAATRVDPDATVSKRLQPTIVRLFGDRQREQRLSAANVEQFPIVIDALFEATAADRSHVYYFESSRSVPNAAQGLDPDADPIGTLRISVAGWLRETDRRVVSLGTTSDLQWDQVDEQGRVRRQRGLTPIGVLQQPTSMAWVMKGSEGRAASVAIYEVGRPRVQMTLRLPVARC